MNGQNDPLSRQTILPFYNNLRQKGNYAFGLSLPDDLDTTEYQELKFRGVGKLFFRDKRKKISRTAGVPMVMAKTCGQL